jgi:hypothetical protein
VPPLPARPRGARTGDRHRQRRLRPSEPPGLLFLGGPTLRQRSSPRRRHRPHPRAAIESSFHLAPCSAMIAREANCARRQRLDRSDPNPLVCIHAAMKACARSVARDKRRRDPKEAREDYEHEPAYGAPVPSRSVGSIIWRRRQSSGRWRLSRPSQKRPRADADAPAEAEAGLAISDDRNANRHEQSPRLRGSRLGRGTRPVLAHEGRSKPTRPPAMKAQAAGPGVHGPKRVGNHAWHARIPREGDRAWWRRPGPIRTPRMSPIRSCRRHRLQC